MSDVILKILLYPTPSKTQQTHVYNRALDQGAVCKHSWLGTSKLGFPANVPRHPYWFRRLGRQTRAASLPAHAVPSCVSCAWFCSCLQAREACNFLHPCSQYETSAWLFRTPSSAQSQTTSEQLSPQLPDNSFCVNGCNEICSKTQSAFCIKL